MHSDYLLTLFQCSLHTEYHLRTRSDFAACGEIIRQQPCYLHRLPMPSHLHFWLDFSPQQLMNELKSIRTGYVKFNKGISNSPIILASVCTQLISFRFWLCAWFNQRRMLVNRCGSLSLWEAKRSFDPRGNRSLGVGSRVFRLQCNRTWSCGDQCGVVVHENFPYDEAIMKWYRPTTTTNVVVNMTYYDHSKNSFRLHR